MYLYIVLKTRACERSMSGAENGAERAENRMSGNGAVSGLDKKRWSGSEIVEERELSGERAKSPLMGHSNPPGYNDKITV